MLKITQQQIQIPNNGNKSKTEPASNPEVSNADLKEAMSSIQYTSPAMSKNSSKVLPSSLQVLTSERHKYLLMESQVRRLNKRIQIQQELIRNKKLYHKIEEELQNQEQLIRKKKKQLIQSRLQEAEKIRKQKREKEMQSDRTVAQLKLRERKKEFILQKILEKNKNQHEQCYQKALLERKFMLRPINFQAIDSHERNYLKARKHLRTMEDHYEEEEDHSVQKSQSKNESLRYKQRNDEYEQKEKSLSLRQEKNSQASGRNKQRRPTVEQYLETRRKEEKRIEELKQLLQKQKQYGNRVQIQYHKNRAKTESIDFQKQRERQFAEEKAKSINERNKILKNMKKPVLPQYFNGNLEEKKRYQIERVVRSSHSPEQKMRKLNQMSLAQSHQLNVRNRVEDLERLNQINMLRAELLLSIE